MCFGFLEMEGGIGKGRERGKKTGGREGEGKMKYLLTASGLSLRKLYGPGKQQDKCSDSISASFLGTRVMVPTEAFRPWANRSYNPGSLGTIYSAGCWADLF